MIQGSRDSNSSFVKGKKDNVVKQKYVNYIYLLAPSDEGEGSPYPIGLLDLDFRRKSKLHLLAE